MNNYLDVVLRGKASRRAAAGAIVVFFVLGSPFARAQVTGGDGGQGAAATGGPVLGGTGGTAGDGNPAGVGGLGGTGGNGSAVGGTGGGPFGGAGSLNTISGNGGGNGGRGYTGGGGGGAASGGGGGSNNAAGGSGGGGGGGNGVTANGYTAAADVSGGAGGAGGAAGLQGDGGGGGGGGNGVLLTGGTLHVNMATHVTGGGGAVGGSSQFDGGGGGGGGGYGVRATGGATLVNFGAILGGAGGTGGDTIVNGSGRGAGGGGGIGVALEAGGSIVNSGSITGGAGGAIGSFHPGGAGGAGIAGAGLAIIDSGAIVGGLSGAGVQADAIAFTGGANVLTLQSGWSLAGNIDVTGTLSFNQAIAVNLANAINGSGAISQDGVGTLTLASANTYTGGTTINSGIVEAAHSFLDAGNHYIDALGGGPVAFSGGGLRVTTAAGTSPILPNDIAVLPNANGAILAAAGVVLTLQPTSFSLGANSVTQFGSPTDAGTVTFNPLGINTANIDPTAAIVVAGGTLRSDSFGFLGSFVLIRTASTTVNAAAVLDLSQDPVGEIHNLKGSGSVKTDAAAFPGVPSLSLVVDPASSSEFSGVISGPGAVEVSSSGFTGGTMILSGANTYTGGTEICFCSTLQLGNGGASGSILGDVANGGTLVFDRSDKYVFSGVISDDSGAAGSLVQAGVGVTVLTGANTYSGGTFFNAGTLSVASDANLGAPSGALNFNGGVLQITGTTFASTARAINWGANGGGFDIADAANVFTVSQSLSSGGPLTKLGAGVLTLTAANTYTGGTTISAGTLQLGNGGTSGSIAGNIIDNGALAFNRSDSVAFGGVVSGSGSVNQLGPGTLTLTAANAYTGGTTISAGTLQIGNGGTSGSIAGNVTDNGALAFNRSNNTTFSGVISGRGAVSQLGQGALTLSGANTYAGGTSLNAGALVVGNSGALGTGPLTMQDGTVLQFAQSGLNLANAIAFPGIDPTIDTGANSETLSGVISGTGGVTKAGSGALMLTAVNTYTGATTVAAGALIVDGSIAASSLLTVDSGATLGGSGTVGSVTLLSGATAAPGAATPFTTLRVAGDVAFAPGATYLVNVNAAGQTDSLAVTGKAIISGGTVDVLAASGGVYGATTRYTLLTAQRGLSGAFASLTTTSNLAFLTPVLSYDAKDVFLGFTQTVTPSGPVTLPSVAITPNQAATAAAIQAQGSGAVYNAVLGQSVAGARQAFDALSGEIHASAVSAAFDDSRLPREAVLDRLASPYGALVSGGATGFSAMNAIAAPSPPAQTFTAWGQAFGSWGHVGGDGNAATLERSMGGFILGVDATLDSRYRLGVAGGYTQSILSLDARASSGRVDSTFATIYGGASLNALQLRGGATYAYNRYATDRTIAFPGFDDAASSGYGGDTLQAFGEAGWRMPVAGLAGPTFVEPFVGALAMHIDTAGFAEAGGAAALTGASQSYDYGATTLGLRAETTLFSDAPLTARGMLGWRHVFGDVTPSSTLAFASAPSLPFAIAGAPIARDALALEAGFDWRLTPTATVGVFYSGALAARDNDNAVKGKVEVAF
jgi:fibronectin-binding autotransporter adhesin